MTRDQTLAILGVIKYAYPNSFKGLQGRELDNVAALWTTMLADHPAEAVNAAVEAYIANDTRGFAPHIGAVLDEVAGILGSPAIPPMEAWRLVRNALCRSGYDAAEEFAKLPETVRRVVGSPAQLHEWSAMPSMELETVIGARFNREYRETCESDRRALKLPSSTRVAAANLAAARAGELPERADDDGDERLAADAVGERPPRRRIAGGLADGGG